MDKVTDFRVLRARKSLGGPLCGHSRLEASGVVPPHSRLKNAYYKTHCFLKVPRDLPLSGVNRRLDTVLKDILEQCHVAGTNLTIRHLKYTLF